LSDVIHVEARFQGDGEILPLVFVWEERRFSVLALGRQWREGPSHHFLVMTSGEQVFEITYNGGAAQRISSAVDRLCKHSLLRLDIGF
jgi:hypothetical protein